jgi:hypothetical protein
VRSILNTESHTDVQVPRDPHARMYEDMAALGIPAAEIPEQGSWSSAPVPRLDDLRSGGARAVPPRWEAWRR